MPFSCSFSLLLTIFISCVPYTPLPLNLARCSLGHGSRIQQLHPPIRLHLLLLHPHPLLFYKRCVTRGHHGAASVHGCCLDALSTELYQVNVCVNRIARRQAIMVVLLLRFLLHLLKWLLILRLRMMMNDDDGDDNNASFDDNRDASSPNDDEMST